MSKCKDRSSAPASPVVQHRGISGGSEDTPRPAFSDPRKKAFDWWEEYIVTNECDPQEDYDWYVAGAITAHTEAAVKGKEAAMLRAYHITLDSLGAPADEWPCNRAAFLVRDLTARLAAAHAELADARNAARILLDKCDTLKAERDVLRLATDAAEDEVVRLTTRLAAAEGERDEKARDVEGYKRLWLERSQDVTELKADLARLNEPRAVPVSACPNCEEIWPARLAEARGEIARLTAAYERDVQVDRQQYADVLQHAADLRATSDLFERERDTFKAALAAAEAVRPD